MDYDTIRIRSALADAIREWVERGDKAEHDCQEAAKKKDKAAWDAAWPALDASHEQGCAAHNESLNCCLDKNHEKHGDMLDFLADKMVETLSKEKE